VITDHATGRTDVRLDADKVSPPQGTPETAVMFLVGSDLSEAETGIRKEKLSSKLVIGDGMNVE